MPEASLFQIEAGVFALALVDKTEAGYAEAWQAPGGATVDTVTEADYDPSSTTWKCQLTAGAITPSPDTTTTDVPATFCAPAKTIPVPAETSYSLDATFLQDPHIRAGLSRFLFEYDTMEAYFLLGLDGDNPPKAIGRVRVQAGAIGGEARTTLTADISLPLSRKPQIEFGDANDSEPVPPNTTTLPLDVPITLGLTGPNGEAEVGGGPDGGVRVVPSRGGVPEPLANLTSIDWGDGVTDAPPDISGGFVAHIYNTADTGVAITVSTSLPDSGTSASFDVV